LGSTTKKDVVSRKIIHKNSEHIITLHHRDKEKNETNKNPVIPPKRLWIDNSTVLTSYADDHLSYPKERNDEKSY
jgi:hypothetical protein